MDWDLGWQAVEALGTVAIGAGALWFAGEQTSISRSLKELADAQAKREVEQHAMAKREHELRIKSSEPQVHLFPDSGAPSTDATKAHYRPLVQMFSGAPTLVTVALVNTAGQVVKAGKPAVLSPKQDRPTGVEIEIARAVYDSGIEKIRASWRLDTGEDRFVEIAAG